MEVPAASEGAVVSLAKSCGLDSEIGGTEESPFVWPIGSIEGVDGVGIDEDFF